MTRPSCLDVNDKNAVLAAIKEFKKLKRDKFLKEYGFKHARQYFIEYKGELYDCKPILVSAFHHQYGRPLGEDHKATGGVNPRVKPHLEDMGFTVIDKRSPTNLNVITSIEEIKQNLSLFEDYLCGDVSDKEQIFAYDLVKKGVCFIAYNINSEWRFAPSRYVGYANNSIKAHNDNQNKNGGSTDAAIDKALGDCTQDDELENKYRAFCIKLEIVCNEKQRQYWRFNIKGVDFKQNSNSDDGFPEGKEDEKLHKKRERSAKLIRLAKETFLKNHEKLYCMVCEFDFEAFYGERGQGYIEAHHTIPVSEMKEGDKTKVKDIALVCANCHRMLHRTPWLTIDELKKLLKK